MKAHNDVFGRALYDWSMGGTLVEALERDDGFTQSGAGSEVYLSEFKEWPAAERRAVRHLRGRVLDVGCGAGRVALELEHRGFDVVGVDASPLGAKAARVCGVTNVWCNSLEKLSPKIKSFDSLVLFGNNFGIFGTPERARKQLTLLAKWTKPDARIFVESTNAFFGGAPAMNRSYYARNKQRGLSPGQLRVRFRYADLTGQWFSWIYVSQNEMRLILRGTGWRQERILATALGEPYVAILTKG